MFRSTCVTTELAADVGAASLFPLGVALSVSAAPGISKYSVPLIVRNDCPRHRQKIEAARKSRVCRKEAMLTELMA